MSFAGIDADSLVSLIIGVVGALLAFFGVKITARSNEKAAEPASWQMLTQEMKAFFKLQLEERDKRLTALEGQVSQHHAYHQWLTALDLPRPPFKTFHEWSNDVT